MDTSTPRPVVVGIDSLEESGPALVWASREAERRGASLDVVHCDQRPHSADALIGAFSTEVLERIDEEGRRTLASARALALELAPGTPVHTTSSHTHPRGQLLHRAQDAELVVTGARRRGSRRPGSAGGLQLGSTSLFLASHAPCPVVVVAQAPLPGATGVVVGHDGSPAADAALGFAAAHAVATDQHLSVVRAWQTPVDRAYVFDDTAFARARAAQEEAGQRQLEDLARRVALAHPGLRLSCELVENAHPGDALLTLARHAALLVVGSRGHGAFTSALLGSTSHDVLHRAECPVAVVPDPERIGESRRRFDREELLAAVL